MANRELFTQDSPACYMRFLLVFTNQPGWIEESYFACKLLTCGKQTKIFLFLLQFFSCSLFLAIPLSSALSIRIRLMKLYTWRNLVFLLERQRLIMLILSKKSSFCQKKDPLQSEQILFPRRFNEIRFPKKKKSRSLSIK